MHHGLVDSDDENEPIMYSWDGSGVALRVMSDATYEEISDESEHEQALELRDDREYQAYKEEQKEVMMMMMMMMMMMIMMMRAMVMMAMITSILKF